MAFATLAGVVSNLQNQARHGRGSRPGAVEIIPAPVRWRQSWHAFLVDGRPVQIRTLDPSPQISDGDHVTLVGRYRGQIFVARAVRNDSKGRVHSAPTSGYMGLGVVGVILGVFTSVFIIGLVLFPAGCYLLYQGYRNSSAAATAKLIPASAVDPPRDIGVQA